MAKGTNDERKMSDNHATKSSKLDVKVAISTMHTRKDEEVVEQRLLKIKEIAIGPNKNVGWKTFEMK